MQIKLPEQSESSASSEQPWKPKRDKQRKDYAELFGQRKMKKISEEEKKTMLTIYNKITSEKVNYIPCVELVTHTQLNVG